MLGAADRGEDPGTAAAGLAEELQARDGLFADILDAVEAALADRPSNPSGEV